MSDHHAHSEGCCGHQRAVHSVHQTLDEMEFERGIWSAALNGEEERIRQFVRDRVDLNRPDTSGYVALHYAARNGNLKTCQLLIDGGASVNIQTRSGQASPLHRAAYCGHSDIVNLLKQHGADPYLCDSDGQTPLHKAAEGGSTEVINVLLSWKPELLKMIDLRGRLPKDCLKKDKKELLNLLTENEKN